MENPPFEDVFPIENGDWLSQWPTFKLLGTTYSIGKTEPFKLLFHGPKWLSKGIFHSYVSLPEGKKKTKELTWSPFAGDHLTKLLGMTVDD